MRRDTRETLRQRWMLYLVYAAATWVCLGVIVLLITLDGTRNFIGERGVEYCWMYGTFSRYVWTHLALIGVDVAVLLILYRLACRQKTVVFLVVLLVWLLNEPILSFLTEATAEVG